MPLLIIHTKYRRLETERREKAERRLRAKRVEEWKQKKERKKVMKGNWERRVKWTEERKITGGESWKDHWQKG